MVGRLISVQPNLQMVWMKRERTMAKYSDGKMSLEFLGLCEIVDQIKYSKNSALNQYWAYTIKLVG